MPSAARVGINEFLEVVAPEITGKVLFVGVNYQWETKYREWFKHCEFVTMDIDPDTYLFKPDIVADIQNCWELPEDHYDLIIMTGIWEILPYPENAREQIYRMLKKGGKVITGHPGKSFHLNVIKYTVSEVVFFLEDYFNIELVRTILLGGEDPCYILALASK